MYILHVLKSACCYFPLDKEEECTVLAGSKEVRFNDSRESEGKSGDGTIGQEGSPILDKHGLIVSQSWAILNTSTASSPHLSPVTSETSIEYPDTDYSTAAAAESTPADFTADADATAATGDNATTNPNMEALMDKLKIVPHKSEHSFLVYSHYFFY